MPRTKKKEKKNHQAHLYNKGQPCALCTGQLLLMVPCKKTKPLVEGYSQAESEQTRRTCDELPRESWRPRICWLTNC